MQRCLDEPALISSLAQKGYLSSSTGDIISMEQHLLDLQYIYQQRISNRKLSHGKYRPLADNI